MSSKFDQTLEDNGKPQIHLILIKLVSASGNPISVQGEYSIKLSI